MQVQSNSFAAGMQFPNNEASPATAVGQSDSQPAAAAADPMLPVPTTAVGQADTQRAAEESAPESNAPVNSSAAVPSTVNSAEQESAGAADLTGTITAAGSITNIEQCLSCAQLGQETPKDAYRTQDAQQAQGAVQPSLQPAQGSNKLQTDVQQVDEPVRGLADPKKRLLAKMGSQAASDVSKQLLQEIAARSHVKGLLQVRTLLLR